MQPEPLRAPGKGGLEEPLDHALGRSRGGLTTKIHLVCDASGVPLGFLLSPGQASDIGQAYAFPESQGGLANAVAGYWPTKAAMPSTCVSTATATAFSR